MTTTLLPGALHPLPLACRACGEGAPEDVPAAICSNCLAPLDVVYPEDRAIPSRETISSRERSLWRYREWLPFTGDPVHATDVGWTPLIESQEIARALGVARAWVKVDALSAPSLSFKDRVVTTAINAAHAFGLGVIGCASTGNLANAVAAAAARAGLPAWIFVPFDLEPAKLIATTVYGPKLVRVRGTYDDVNRLCAQLADHFNWGIVNVNLRAYYGEGSKTMAFEIAEQLGWRLPSAVVAPMAGGSLVTKLHKGFGEFIDAGLVAGDRPRIYGGQATGCAPIVRLFERGDEKLVPEIPKTIARSLAIGNPADGLSASRVLRSTAGGAVAVDDTVILESIRELAALSGVFGETAAGVTYGAAKALAASGALRPNDEVVICITGNGLKTAEALQGDLDAVPTIAPRLKEVRELWEG
jgi:threonine synthase